MFMHVKLLNGYHKQLTYAVPDNWDTHHLTGSFVRVPLQNRIELAWVEAIAQELTEKPTFIIKKALSQEILPHDPHYYPFLEKLSAYYAHEPFYFFSRIRTFLKQKEVAHLATMQHDRQQVEQEKQNLILTHEQQAIITDFNPHLTHPSYYPALLHGVTGSGKTEIYKDLIKQVYATNKTSLFLVPEVNLAVQFYHLLKRELPPEIPLFTFHSATGVREKRELWEHLLAGTPLVLVGVHLPILLPIFNLGLIIIDEEHEVGYQEKKHPKINTKEAALLRAYTAKIPILLGSATPSLSSLYNVEKHAWKLYKLTNRFAGAFPTIKHVSLIDKNNAHKRKNFWISTELESAIKKQLSRKEQTLVFLNRRGFSFFIQCKQCAFVPHCPNCSVSLTLHIPRDLRCHYCSHTELLPTCCPSCRADESHLLRKGVGTQQLVTILQDIFPTARISRADVDTTVNKKKWQATIQAMNDGNIDILVGTQTITKGYHFPNVTLVGIIWADINLQLPFYNATEITLQQLIQVAGRAGRQSPESLVIVQSMQDHPVFSYLHEQDYQKFYEYEKEHRTTTGYPPIKKLAIIELRCRDEHIIDQEARAIALVLHQLVNKHQITVTILGPAQPPVSRVKNVYTRKMYLKAPSMGHLIQLYHALNQNNYQSSLFFTPQPVNDTSY